MQVLHLVVHRTLGHGGRCGAVVRASRNCRRSSYSRCILGIHSFIVFREKVAADRILDVLESPLGVANSVHARLEGRHALGRGCTLRPNIFHLLVDR